MLSEGYSVCPTAATVGCKDDLTSQKHSKSAAASLPQSSKKGKLGFSMLSVKDNMLTGSALFCISFFLLMKLLLFGYLLSKAVCNNALIGRDLDLGKSLSVKNDLKRSIAVELCAEYGSGRSLCNGNGKLLAGLAYQRYV